MKQENQIKQTTPIERYGDSEPGQDKTVLITGHRGLIGRNLTTLLETLGFHVRGLTRSPREKNEYHWDPERDILNEECLNKVDAVIHLAGENIAGGLWTKARKQRIRESRIQGTQLLVNAMKAQSQPPSVLSTASGVNYYPADGTRCDEDSPGGRGFLAGVCAEWEAEAAKAENHGIRVVRMRTGIVLTPDGGALKLMLPAFKMGLGGPVGNGKQHFPWIEINDLLDLYVKSIINEDWSGPVNAVAPGICPQRTFAKTLGKVLKRPAIFPLPGILVRGLLGEMGKETLLSDLNIHSRFLERMKHTFRNPELGPALAHCLRKK